MNELTARYDKRQPDLITNKIYNSFFYNQFIKLRSISASILQCKRQQLIKISLVLEFINNNFFADKVIKELSPIILRLSQVIQLFQEEKCCNSQIVEN